MILSRSGAQQPLYDELLKGSEFGFFSTFKDIFMTGLLLGYTENRKLPMKKGRGSEAFNETVFSEDDNYLIDAIIFEEHGEMSAENEESQKIIEEYAAGGVAYLYELLIKERSGNAMDQYVELLYDFKDTDSLERYREQSLEKKLIGDEF